MLFRDTTPKPEPRPCHAHPGVYLALDDDDDEQDLFEIGTAGNRGKKAEPGPERAQCIALATRMCEGCPGFTECLRDALTSDMAGFVAATTADQRAKLRTILGLPEPEPIDYGSYAGSKDQGFDRDKTIEVIQRFPELSNGELGRRANCDPHTIARYRTLLAAGTDFTPRIPTLDETRQAYRTLATTPPKGVRGNP